MATNETPYFNIPYPGEDDKSIWYPLLQNTFHQLDAKIFSNLEFLKPVFQHPLPWVQNTAGHNLVQTGDLLMISRTYQSLITVAAASTALTAEAMLCIRIAGGASVAQAATWELVQSGADVDADLQVFGYVNATYDIVWFNATQLPSGSANTIFGSTAGGGSILTGVGNPNGVVAGIQGQTYIDTTVPGAEIRYWNTDGGTTWFVD